jgi:hypothetical protein
MNDSEQFRHECEARHVMKMNKEQRQEYYKGAVLHRGQAAVSRLIDEVNSQWKSENGR